MSSGKEGRGGGGPPPFMKQKGPFPNGEGGDKKAGIQSNGRKKMEKGRGARESSFSFSLRKREGASLEKRGKGKESARLFLKKRGERKRKENCTKKNSEISHEEEGGL